MPGKMARSASQAPFGLPHVLVSRPHLASVLQEGRKSAIIHAGSGVIWGIPAKAAALAGMALVNLWGEEQ